MLKNISDKLAARGVVSLGDDELLALLTEDEELAQQLLAAYGGALARIGTEEPARLRMVGGLGLRRAMRILAAAEFGRRVAAARAAAAEVIGTSDDVVRLFRPQLLPLAHEECWAIYLTSSNRVLERQRVSQGGVQGTVVDHRLIVKRALELLATQLILIHNHPSGAADPGSRPSVDRPDRQSRRPVRHPAAGPPHHRPRRGVLLPPGGADRLRKTRHAPPRKRGAPRPDGRMPKNRAGGGK